MTQYQKGIIVIDYLQSLGTSMFTIGQAIDDMNLETSFRLIQFNPQISKDEFLRIMEIKEED